MTTSALDLSHLDAGVRPQDDLFGYVNGRWLAEVEIPADKPGSGMFLDLRDASEVAVRDILTDLPADADPASEQGKLRRLCASFMDADIAEHLGARPLADILARIDAIDSLDGLADQVGWALRHGVRTLFDVGVEADPGDPKRHALFIAQGGLGLPDEEYYRLVDAAPLRDAYVAHIERSLALAGAQDRASDARLVMGLETRIAACHWDKIRTRDLRAMYNPTTGDDFFAASPALRWDRVLAAAQIPPSDFANLVDTQPSFFTGVAALWTPDELPAWRAWARWCAISSLSSYLSSPFVEERFDFYERTLLGVPALRERWKRGVALAERSMGDAIGKIYVERHFPSGAKHRMDALVAQLLEAYRQSILSLDWMQPATRGEALDKLSKFRPKIGYPTTWRDYSGVSIGDDLVGNVLAVASNDLDYALGKLPKPVDPEEWSMTPQTVNAYYHPLRNEIVFPAAILQPPFFDQDADDAVNFGAIGAVIGHEIGHGFDDQGSTCDGEGALRDWWTPRDRDSFEERTKALIAQYDALSPRQLPDAHVNGALTIGENIGDLGGLGIAIKAWRIATGGVDPEPIDGLTGLQRVFLSYATIWRALMRPDALRHRLAIDPHSPNEFRCNQVVRNVDAFYEAFGVSADDKLWLAPADRVSIWQ